MIRFCILPVILLIVMDTYGQNDVLNSDSLNQTAIGPVKDSLRNYYIKRFPDYFFIYPVFRQGSLNFELTKSDGSASLKFKPNNTYSLGVGFYLFEVGLEFGFAIPLKERSLERYGKSEARDIQVNLLAKRWGVDVFFQRYSGFYLVDAENLPLPDEAFKQRPDINTKNFGLTGHYVFNNQKFSFRSAYNFAERQLYSKGSFLLVSGISTFRVSADSSVVDFTRKMDFGDKVDFTRLRYSTFALAPGYTYNMTYKNFFLNTTLSLGPSHHWINYSLEGNGEVHNEISINTFIAARIAIGYNGYRMFGGISFISQGSNIKFEDVTFSNNNGVFKIVMGYRFKEFGVLKKRAWDFIPFRI
ncbi:MAG: DUF4421 family protein [Cyclobacteriaceae bacterium]